MRALKFLVGVLLQIAIVVVGLIAAFWAASLGLHMFLAILLVLVICGVLGYLYERLAEALGWWTWKWLDWGFALTWLF